ncbi:MAG: type I-E CRISPR-associated endoribonuclease Cas2 [Ignavibacteriaceae bacterium]|nr:type I-E CRISPR-associated endoribonuclease Cas2 [Ignavibacteriaceae bacterium]
MLVMVMETVPNNVRGELSRWLLEVKAGVFVGSVSGLVRDLLWELCKRKVLSGGIWQIYSYNNEQGFLMRQHGVTDKMIADFDGLFLLKKPI